MLKIAWEHKKGNQGTLTQLKLAKQRLSLQYKQLQKTKYNSKQQFKELSMEIDTIKHSIETNTTQEDVILLTKAKMALRELEFKQAICWKRKSQLQWLGLGDAFYKSSLTQSKKNRNKNL
jgi:hypothetical protein